MTCVAVAARAALADLPRHLAHVRLIDTDEPGLQAILGDARLAQRSLEALITRVAARSNQLAAAGRSAPTEDTMRGGGSVRSKQARKEAARADAAEDIPGLIDAMAQGRMSADQVDTVARHRADLTNEQQAAFDTAASGDGGLIDRAEGMTPESFDRIVKKTVDKIIGDGGLGDTKAKQAASEYRHWIDNNTGMGHIHAVFDPERHETITNRIEQQLTTLANTGNRDEDGDDRVTKDKHLAAQAFYDLITGTGSAASGTRASRSGRPAITVIVDHQTLQNGRHDHTICQTRDGHDLPTESLARLCCDATLQRVVLDERGIPINVGRHYRTATNAQWTAINALYPTCAWDGCTAPISWCQLHHIHEWEHGGPTNLDNLIPLCSKHHHQVHEGHWHINMLPDRALQIYQPNGQHYKDVPPPSRGPCPGSHSPARDSAGRDGVMRC